MLQSSPGGWVSLADPGADWFSLAASSQLEPLLLLASVMAIVLMLGVGAARLSRHRPSTTETPLLPGLGRPRPVQPAAAADTRRLAALQGLHASLYHWLAAADDARDLWTAMDQMMREALSERLGAVRVRCFHVRPGDGQVEPLVPTIGGAARASDPVLKQAAATGAEHVGTDGGGAAPADEPWAWVLPIHQDQRVVGLVAVGAWRDPEMMSDELRTAVGQVLAVYWHYVALHEQQAICLRTDRATGVLTRQDFLSLAQLALAEAHANHEPIVVAVVAIEGLRGLDDRGAWRRRDQLVETLGQTIARRVRADDLVGRFTDDRFAVLLRRVDESLGRITTEKLLGALLTAVQETGVEVHVQFRAGLAGSGPVPSALEAMLVTALKTLERARHEDLPLRVARPDEQEREE